MEKQDTQRLFNLIETLYPSSKQQPRTPADLEAWTLVFMGGAAAVRASIRCAPTEAHSAMKSI